MRLVALERDEVLRLLDVAKKDGARSHAMVLLAIRHGLRGSEVCGMRLEHVNLKEAWVRYASNWWVCLAKFSFNCRNLVSKLPILLSSLAKRRSVSLLSGTGVGICVCACPTVADDLASNIPNSTAMMARPWCDNEALCLVRSKRGPKGTRRPEGGTLLSF